MSSYLDWIERAMARGEEEEERGRGTEIDVEEEGEWVCCKRRVSNSSKLKSSQGWDEGDEDKVKEGKEHFSINCSEGSMCVYVRLEAAAIGCDAQWRTL